MVSASAVTTIKANVQLIRASKDINPSLDLVERINLGPGELSICLNAGSLGKFLECDLDELPQDILTITAPFQLRKRGVETKLIFADEAGNQDDVLIKNIAKAHQWYQLIKSGETLAEIARANGTSSRRIQQIIDLAFLAPDIIKMILEGKQPLGFTSDWCKLHPLPNNWQEQRALIATL